MDSHLYRKQIQISYAYRVKAAGADSLTGAQAKVEVWVCADLQDSGEPDAFSVDFDFLKHVLAEHVFAPADGGLILDVHDPLVRTLRPTWSERDLADTVLAVAARGHMTTEGLCGKLYLILDPPTPQNLARHFYERMKEPVLTRSGGRSALLGVRFWRTPEEWAGYGPSFGSQTPIVDWEHML
jgi:6-pyruvoyltetrahydropterin/6-carboxytetrahydropterin synthase